MFAYGFHDQSLRKIEPLEVIESRRNCVSAITTDSQ